MTGRSRVLRVITLDPWVGDGAFLFFGGGEWMDEETEGCRK